MLPNLLLIWFHITTTFFGLPSDHVQLTPRIPEPCWVDLVHQQGLASATEDLPSDGSHISHIYAAVFDVVWIYIYMYGSVWICMDACRSVKKMISHGRAQLPWRTVLDTLNSSTLKPKWSKWTKLSTLQMGLRSEQVPRCPISPISWRHSDSRNFTPVAYIAR